MPELPDDELTPAQTDAVRRALRAARHDGPMPADVASRLDAVLADLAAEDAGDPAGYSSVVPATDRFRRHNRRMAVLAAAAAVTVVGLGATQLLRDHGGDASSARQDSVASGDRSPHAPAADSAESDGAANSRDNMLGSRADAVSTPLTRADRRALTDAGYGSVRAVEAGRLPLASPPAASTMKSESATDDLKGIAPYNAAAIAGCSVPDLDLPGGVVPTYYLARHDGESVVLVVLPGPDVTAFPCGGGSPTPVPLD